MKTVLYQLKGKSLEAAHTLAGILERAVKENPPQQTGNVKEIHDSWQIFYNKLIEKISCSQPEILEYTGLSQAYIDIRSVKNTLPRAYQTYPTIFTSPEREPRYFMYSPIDYKNRHFVPQDGIEITGEMKRHIEELLFAGGWLGNAPLIQKPVIGVEIPHDIGYSTNFAAIVNSFQNQRPTSTQRIFIPGGVSLEHVDDFKRRKFEHNAAYSAVFDEIRRIAAIICPELANDPENYHVNLSGSYGGMLGHKMTFTFSVRDDAGEPIEVGENPYFMLRSKEHEEYEIYPREDTLEGACFADMICAVPPVPSLGEYAELVSDYDFERTEIELMIGVTGRVPQLVEMGGLTFLSYNSDESVVSDFCPKGAKEISMELFNWLRDDQQDRNMGVTPPPMPEKLLSQYSALFPDNTNLNQVWKPSP